MKKLLNILSLLFVSLLAHAQLNCTFTHYSQENGLSENSVMDMVQDHDGMIWFATWDGINRFNGYDFKVYKARKENDMLWSSNRVDHLQVDKQGDVWCITYDGRAFRFDKRMETFTEVPADGIGKELVINSILPLGNGTVWLLTDRNGGIRVVPDKKTGKFTSKIYLSTTNKEKGIAINTIYLKQEIGEELLFEESTAIASTDGRLLFGTNRGLLSFVPGHIRKNAYIPEIVFSGLKIDNQVIVPKPGSVLPESLNSLSHLTLSHKENTVTLSFAALDMSFPENVKYAYILEGFDKEWNYVGKQRTATYTNLPKGDYVFRVKSTNGAGIWVENEHTLNITVKPSFWETPYAYVLYVLVFIFVLLGGAYILFLIYRLKHEVSVEQQVTDMKLRFFTNISHELRTPLTLIEGPLEYILKRADLSKEVREQLQVVERNTHRMLRLVNQILDFRKIQNHKMKLSVEQIDIVSMGHRTKRK